MSEVKPNKYKKMEDVISLIVVFGSFLAIGYLYFSTRNKERMALIEKGADASLFYAQKSQRALNGSNWGLFALKTGMFFMGVAVGVIMGGVLSTMNVLNEGVNYTSMIFFFGGLSLVFSYFIKSKLTDK